MIPYSVRWPACGVAAGLALALSMATAAFAQSQSAAPPPNAGYTLPIDKSLAPASGNSKSNPSGTLGNAGLPIVPLEGQIAPVGAPASGEPPQDQNEKPFGAQLFTGQPQGFGATAINPDYIISHGDQVAVRLWGAFSYEGVQGIDPEGNIFLPQIGPIHLAGVPAFKLNGVVNTAVGKVFTQNIGVYATLMSKQPVTLYVTGGVQNPGRYQGDQFNAPLQFIGEAGGIDTGAGSFRDVRIIRDGKTLAQLDLYGFLAGQPLPTIRFRDNDTIFVGPQRATVSALGDLQNRYRFELGDGMAKGADLIALAQPNTAASNVALRGLRDGKPYNAYVSLKDFTTQPLVSGDSYQFSEDYVSDTIFISVSGQSSGPSSLVVPRGARLGDVLRLIAVDPVVSDIQSIFLRRRGVAQRQQQALDQALDQLRRSVLTTRPASPSDSTVQTQEAQMIQAFIAQARGFKADGRVVLRMDEARDPMILEADDQIVIPARSDVVLITGEVRMPQTVVFAQGRPLADYTAMAGGFTGRADSGNTVLIHLSGAVETGDDSLTVRPGDQIVVMPRTDFHGFAVLSDIINILYQLAVSTGVTVRLVQP
jgi:protein involved in polysaccharide export with SLBB domain